MNQRFQELLYSWSKPYIRDQDISTVFQGKPNCRYDAVKYALKKGILQKLIRGLYMIHIPYSKTTYELFEIAQAIQGPSYISFETALSYSGWIPEKVQTCTSATAKRSKSFMTPIANFSYSHIPVESFKLQVQRIETSDGIFLLATPWKAIADHIYVHNRKWSSLEALMSDMRIEVESIREENLTHLEELAKIYANARVRKQLMIFVKDLRG